MGYLGTKPANSPLTSELIPDGMISTSDLANGAVSPAKLSTGAPNWDASGNVGIGTIPNNWSLSGIKVLQQSSASLYGYAGTETGYQQNAYYDGGWKYINASSSLASQYQQFAGTHVWSNAVAGTAGNAITFTERMRIDSSGNLLVGTTAQQTGANGKISVAGAVDGVAGTFTNNSNGSAYTLQVFNYTTATGGGTGRFITFRSGSTPTQVGSISGDGTNTTYSTSSDYRLKENIAPMTGALATVAQLKPVTYTWKLNGSAGNGFIAHELQAVCPQAVIGEKDAVDENGNIEPQGIDTSFLVATLTAAIQEQQVIITELKTRIEALEQA